MLTFDLWLNNEPIMDIIQTIEKNDSTTVKRHKRPFAEITSITEIEEESILSLLLLKQGSPIEISSKEEGHVSPKKVRRTPELKKEEAVVIPSVANDGSEYENEDEEISEGSSEDEDSNLEIGEDEVEDEYHEIKKKSRRRSNKHAHKTWSEFFGELKRTISITGKFPTFQTKNVHMWRWLDEQCELNEASRLSKEHYNALYELGFDFVKSDSKRTPTRVNKKRFPLSSWIHAQRTQRRKGKLSKYRVKLLNKLGFIWEPMKNEPTEADGSSDEEFDIQEELKKLSPQDAQREMLWLENYQRLKEFKKKFGHLRVPTDMESAKDYFEE